MTTKPSVAPPLSEREASTLLEQVSESLLEMRDIIGLGGSTVWDRANRAIHNIQRLELAIRCNAFKACLLPPSSAGTSI